MTYDEVCAYAEENNIPIKLFDNPRYPNSIIGLTVDDRAIYDMEQMIVDLMEEDKMSYIDALEFIEYNTIRALSYMGEDAPIILYTKEF
ncbi:MAG: hypothetical protein ACI4VQ_07955 [Clostridia bacterium]